MSLVTFANDQTDPTRTSVLRSQFSAAARSRFNGLRNYAVRSLMDDQDRLGLFFVGQYMDSLQRQEEQQIFEDNNASWMVPFVLAAIMAGTRYADKALSGRLKPLGYKLEPVTTKPEFFQNEVDILQAKNFTLLRGITDVMNQQIKNMLIQGIHQGQNPRDVAQIISDRILSIGRTRAEILARTETIGAHADATLNRFELYGLNHVAGQAEILTAHDNRVCEICAGLDGTIFTIAEARGIIPLHPRCRCCWLPVVDKISLGRLRFNNRSQFFWN